MQVFCLLVMKDCLVQCVCVCTCVYRQAIVAAAHANM